MTPRPITEQDMLKCGLSLLKRCFVPLLLAVILCNITSVLAAAIEQTGTNRALAAAAHLQPGEEPDFTDWKAYSAYQQARSEYTAAYNAAYAPYYGAACIVQLTNLIVAPVVLLGLNRALLRALDGGKCTIRDLLGGLHGAKRAILVHVLIGLIQIGVVLAGILLMTLLASFLYEIGAILGGGVLLIFMLWFNFRYKLADLHCTDSSCIDLSATDCLRYAHADQQQYGILGFLFTLWPALAISLGSILLTAFFSAPWVNGVTLLLNMLAALVELPVLAAIYAALHSPQADPSEEEGRARAIALANQRDGE